MNEARLSTIEQIREFLAGTADVAFTVPTEDVKRRRFIATVLQRFRYFRLSRGSRGVLFSYMQRLSGYSRQHLSRLLAQYRHTQSLPVELASELFEHNVASVQKMGWSGLKNGELLARAASQFDVMLTADRNLPYQQNLDRLPIAVIVLMAKSNRIEALRALLPRLLVALSSIQPRTIVQLGA